jgi:hypothetical protein
MSEKETQIVDVDSAFWNNLNLRILKLMLEGKTIKEIAEEVKKPVKHINDIITEPIFLQRFTGYTETLSNIFEQTQSKLLNELTNILMKKVKNHLKDLKPAQALTELGKLLALQKGEKGGWAKRTIKEPMDKTKPNSKITVEEMFGYRK